MIKNNDVKRSLIKYTVGFLLSLVLTLGAFGIVMQHVASHHETSHTFVVAVLVGLAIVQLVVQLSFFLHLGHESRPRWNLVVFLFMIMVLVIVVFGSLWIMQNLDYNMMSPGETKEYLHDHPGSF